MSLPRLRIRPDLHAATPAGAAVEAKRPLSPALAVFLAGHVLRDGEVVLLVLKPSVWFILLISLKIAAAMAICAIASKLWLPEHVAWYYVEAAAFLVVGRLMWSTLLWVNRIYILTDQRVLRLAGVFQIEIFDCGLRKIGATRVVYSFRERLLRLGSVEIIPSDERKPTGLWQTVRRPAEVEEMIQAAMKNARMGMPG